MAVTYDSGAITLDKPPANSYDIEFMGEMAQAIEAADADASARVVVVRSATREVLLRRRRHQALSRQRGRCPTWT